MTTIEQFCTMHDACDECLEWALSTGCKTMDQLWLRDDMRPDWRMWIATRRGVLDDKTLRLFAVLCARSVLHIAKDSRCSTACDVASRFAHGRATHEELDEAREDAWAAAKAAGWPSSSDASRHSASIAALDSAIDSALVSALAAAWDSDLAALWGAASMGEDKEAARKASASKQCRWLLENARPVFVSDSL